MYFTPDGRYAIVVAERLAPPRLPRPAHVRAAPLAARCRASGVDHIDFSADGRYLLASCEFSGQLVKVDVARRDASSAYDRRCTARERRCRRT